jgi:sugar lactone lactonase YvrE
MAILAPRLQAQYVSTVVSNGLSEPYGATTDPGGNVYITDTVNNRVVKYVPTLNTVSTLAGGDGQLYYGTNNGAGGAARFNTPKGIVYARGGLVVVDQGNQQLRYVSLAGAVSNLAGMTGVYGASNGPALGGARFTYPTGIAVANDGATLYIADQGNNAIRMLSTNNVVSTVAVGGYQFNSPSAVAVDNNNNLWVADSGHDVICVISNGTSTVEVIAGTPGVIGTNDSLTAASAQFNLPSGLFWDNNNNLLVISDTRNNTVRSLFVTNVQGVTGYAVQTLAGVPGTHGFVDGALGVAEFWYPFGLCLDATASGYYVVDSDNNALRALQPTEPPPPPVPVPNPVIGYVTFPIVQGEPYATFNPITQQISIFNNVPTLAVEQLDPTVQTYMSYGATGTSILPPSSSTGQVSPVFTLASVGATGFPGLSITIMPSLTLETISEATGRPSSAAVSAIIDFVTANPNILGNDAADIILSNATAGAQMYYVLDNSTNSPTNDGSYGIGPVTSGTTLTLNITSNVNLKVRAFADGFAPSATVIQTLTVANDIGNQLDFGFASGVASSKYITAPGRTYFAPVTITELPGTSMYSLQFDLTESGTNYPVGTNTWNFGSRMTYPTSNGYLAYIPPEIVNPTSPGSTNFTLLPTGNITTNNVMELAWITIPPQTNLYPANAQDLTGVSEAQGYGFSESDGQVLVGFFSFLTPSINSVGNTYTLQASLPSASTFGSQTSPGVPTGVFIQALTNGSPGVGSINALKKVTVTNSVSYLVGDVYPFSWYNAGEFGDSNLLNDDVIMTYVSAVGSTEGPYNYPPPASDYFDAMDSANSLAIPYDADDSAINLMTTGDGILAVNDVYVTLRRSLDTNLIWWVRTWSNGSLVVSPFTNFVSSALHEEPLTTAHSQAPVVTPRFITVAADQIQSGGNLSVQVPIRVLAADPIYPVRVLMQNVEVEPLDGSPPITSAISFATGANLSSQPLSSSQGPNNYAGAWLDSTVSGVSGTNIIGTLSVTLPSNVTTNSAYRVHFDHFSASPNGLALFKTTVQDGLITVGDRSGSSWGDGISDSWRLRCFGTVSNALSAADADPDGDGASNWAEYVAGTNPLDATSIFQLQPGGSTGSSSFTLQWPSVVNKHYTVQSSSSLTSGSWTTLATNIPGNGQSMQWTDSNGTGQARFYRALVQ